MLGRAATARRGHMDFGSAFPAPSLSRSTGVSELDRRVLRD